MLTKERLERCAKTPFPWEGKTQSRKQFKDKPILTLLFRDPSYFYWSYGKAKTGNFNWLYSEMKLLLDAISTIKPVAKCKGGKTVYYWSLYKGIVNFHMTCCKDENCKCRDAFATERNSLVPHSFKWMLTYLEQDVFEKLYLEGFKQDYGLPPRYIEKKYLDWLLENANLEALKV